MSVSTTTRAALTAWCAAIALAPPGSAAAAEATTGANRTVAGRFVRVESGAGPRQDYLHFAELEVYAGGRNVAVGRPVTASSTMQPFAPARAVDGVVEYVFNQNASFWHSAGAKGNEWWELDLGAEAAIEKLVLYNRLDACAERLDGAVLTVLTAGRATAFRQVLSSQKNPTEIVFFERPLPPVDLGAMTLAERMAAVAPRFTAPSDDPAAVMPVGSGDFSAMLRYGDACEIHLSKSDFFAVEQKPYHYSPTIHSPGHVQLSFGIPRAAIRSFAQRIDFVRGSVVLELAAADGTVTAEAFGVMGRNVLMIAVDDTRPSRTATATFSAWRDAVNVASAGGVTVGSEVHEYDERGKTVTNAAAVDRGDRMYDLGVAAAVAFADASGQIASTSETGGVAGADATATIRATRLPARYWLVVACATTYDGGPETAARALLDGTTRADKAALLEEHLAWWSAFWHSSWVDLYGKDAERLMGLWYAGYYSYASVANAAVLPKFNGGPGLVQRDDRSWGWGYWWQNTRELIWPLFAGNRLRYAREYLDFYDRQYMSWKGATARQGKLGIRMWEGASPLKPGVAPPPKVVSAFDAAALARAVDDRRMEDVGSGYNARSLAPSVELAQLMFEYVAFTGDAAYLKTTVAPWLKEASLFYLSYLRRGDDGLYHSMVSDAAEMWWRVKDPGTDLAAARYCFWQALKYGTEFGYEPAFLDALRDRLDHLAPLPTGLWKRRKATDAERPPRETGNVTIVDTIDRGVDCFAPAADLLDDRVVHNQENPELYLVFPFALVDARSPKAELDRAVNTFRLRFHPNSAGWSQCPVQAARLRLDDTVDVIMDHVRRHQKYPYGGWNSPGGRLNGSSLGVNDVPYFDSVGVNLTALQEALVQSHVLSAPLKTDAFGGGPIAILPAVRPDWAGRFKLRCRGSFVVTVEFQRRRAPVTVAVESERGGTLKLVNPFESCRVTRKGATVLTSRDREISVPTRAGDVLVFASAAAAGR